jgi:hypothetical protein
LVGNNIFIYRTVVLQSCLDEEFRAVTPKFMPKNCPLCFRHIDPDAPTLASLSRQFSPEIVEALKQKFRIVVESLDLHRDDEAKRRPKVKAALETILRELTTERMPNAHIYAGYYGVRLEPLEKFAHFLERAIQKTPKHRRGPNPWRFHLLAVNVGRVLAEHGISLSVYPEGHFGFAVAELLTDKPFNYDKKDVRPYLRSAIKKLKDDEDFMLRVPKVQRDRYKSIRHCLPRDKVKSQKGGNGS